MARFLFSAFRAYFELLELIFKKIEPGYRRPAAFATLAKIVGFDDESVSIDERIRKIDVARQNLNEAIEAIEELRSQADLNKRDLDDALRRISEMEKQKEEIGKELDVLKQVASADTNAFRKIVGIPTKKDVWRERLLGFASGVLASIIASILFLIALHVLHIA